MVLRNCISCGKLFNALHEGVRLCADCELKEQERFDRVKAYIKGHPGATALQIVRDTGVERQELYEWVRAGRIDVAGMDGLGLNCEICGTPITSGRLCPQCGLRIHQEARQALGAKGGGRGVDGAERSKGGFHIHNSLLKRQRRD